ncbi:MAG: hypothetical protein R3B07_26555 [Polyangiaceae bacterium]
MLIPDWLAAQGIHPGDINALEIPGSWISGEPKAGDPSCEAVQVGSPPHAGLLCVQRLGADNDPRFPDDTRWELWRVEQGRLNRVWQGRQTLDGLSLTLEWETPRRFHIGGSPATTCRQIERRMQRKYSQYHNPIQRVVPSQVRHARDDFCDQWGAHEWDGHGFKHEP